MSWILVLPLATAKGYVFEDKGGDKLRLPGVGIVADVAQTLPNLKNVSRDVHAADGLDDDTVLHKEALDAVRKIARHGVAVPTIEVGNKDMPPPSLPKEG